MKPNLSLENRGFLETVVKPSEEKTFSYLIRSHWKHFWKSSCGNCLSRRLPVIRVETNLYTTCHDLKGHFRVKRGDYSRLRSIFRIGIDEIERNVSKEIRFQSWIQRVAARNKPSIHPTKAYEESRTCRPDMSNAAREREACGYVMRWRWH